MRIEGRTEDFFHFRAFGTATVMAEVTVPEPAARAGRQLGVCWGPGNSMLLHVKKSKAEQQQGSAGSSGEKTKVHLVRWETTLYEPVFRKLVNESLGIFLSLQKLAEEETTGPVSDQLVVNKNNNQVLS